MNSVISSAPDPQSAARPLHRWLTVSRPRAFVTHLCTSAAIVATVCALVFLVWYPSPYFSAAGTWEPLRVLIGVDLVLGPLLTLLLFKPGKKGLKFDLAVIVVVQLAALVYGVAVIFAERPYYSIFAIDRFVVIPRAELDADARALAVTRIGAKPFVGPALAVARRPTDPAAQSKLVEETLFGGKPDIDHRPEFWVPYSEGASEAIAKAKPLSSLPASHADVRAQIAALPRRLGLAEQRLGFVPLVVRDRYSALVIDTSEGRPVAVIDQDPWAND